jgi:hypothetical protein
MTIEELMSALIAEHGERYRVTAACEMRQSEVGGVPTRRWHAYLWTSSRSDCAASAYSADPREIAALLRANRDKRASDARDRLAEIGGAP